MKNPWPNTAKSPEDWFTEVWVTRTLYAVGLAIAGIGLASILGDLLAGVRLDEWAGATDLFTIAVGAFTMLLARRVANNYWKILLLGAFTMLLVNYGFAATRSGRIECLFAAILLLEFGSGALVPWESLWQGLFSALSVLDYAIVTRVVADGSDPSFERWIAIAASIGLAMLCCTLRSRFAADLEQANNLINHNEIRFRQLLSFIPEGVTIVRERDLVITEMLGRGVDSADRLAFEGKQLGELAFYKDNPTLRQFFRDVIKGSEVDDREIALTDRSGAAVPYLASGMRMEISGEPSIVCFTRRITELKNIQKRLAESDHRFRSIFAAMPGSAAIVDLNGKLLDLNRPLEGSGFTREEAVGKTQDEVGFWADPAERAEFEQRFMRDMRVDSMEVRIGKKGGGSVPAILSARPLQIDGNWCIVAIAHNIEELKEAQRKAEESQARFEKVFHAGTDSIVLSDFNDGTVLDVNEEFTKLTGYAREEVVGRHAADLTLWTENAKAAEFVAALRQSGQVRDIETEVQRRDGTMVPCLMSGALMEVAGRPCCIAIARDITKIRKTQEQLVEAREAALSASRAKSEFLSSMSHEIRTPMNAILGMTELLAETDLSPEQRRYLEVMTANGGMLLELINSILDLAKIESGRLQIEQSEFDLRAVVEKVAAGFAVSAHSKGLELCLRIAPDVPERLVGDSLRLGQVLVNLIGNAIKFTEIGEVAIDIETETQSAQECRLRFSVSDTGIGIPRDKLESIFSSFTQADSSTTRRFGGTGLGLAIAQRLVRLMDGDVRADSEPDRGSTFTFTARFGLPRAGLSGVAPSGSRLEGLRVLVADGNATSRFIAGEILNSLGAQAIVADCGQAALSIAREAALAGRPFTSALIDMRMPDSDGLETATRILAEGGLACAPILMMTSDDMKPQLMRLREAGLDTYLVKPVTRRGLIQALASVRGQAEANTAAAPAVPAAAALPRARILVAEDAPTNRLVLSAYLRKTPCELDFAENGRIAVEKFASGHYDLVLMDIQMPVMDGYEATRAIRSWEAENNLKRTPIAALTASALDDAVARAREAGCDEHIAKPVQKAALFDLVRRCVEPKPAAHATGHESAAIA